MVSWSGGKDCTLALHSILSRGEYRVASLMTTVNEEYGRVSMHGVRRALLQQQATSLELPLHEIPLPVNVSNDEYGRIMEREMRTLKEAGINKVVFGDVFLEDVRKYREENLKKVAMEAVFPNWGRPSKDIVLQLRQLGFQAIVTCVDTKQFDGSFVGRCLDEKFFSDLPRNVDPCGENGEYHTFVFDGPIFSEPIRFTKGDVVLRDDRFMYIELCEL